MIFPLPYQQNRMSLPQLPTRILVSLGLALLCATAIAVGEGPSPLKAQLQIESGHSWRPPFGLDRVGRPFEAVVTIAGKLPPAGEFVLVGYRDGKEVSRQGLALSEKSPVVRTSLEAWPAEVALLVKSTTGGPFVELARQKVAWPVFEADAVAQPDRIINPVDLGTILVPADWLLLAGGQKANVAVAAISRSGDFSAGRVTTWYESAPQQKSTSAIPLPQGRKAQVTVALGPCSQTLERDVLHVAIEAGDSRELWHKTDPRNDRAPSAPVAPVRRRRNQAALRCAHLGARGRRQVRFDGLCPGVESRAQGYRSCVA